MKATLTRAQIQAMLTVALKKGLRTHLVGAWLDADRKTVTATDGMIMLTARVELTGTGRAFLPRDLLERLAKVMPKDGAAEITLDGSIVADCGGTRIESPWPDVPPAPDFVAVVPRSASGKPAQFDPELIAKLAKAFAFLKGARIAYPELAYNGESATIAIDPSSDVDAFALIMPRRATAAADFAGRVQATLGEPIAIELQAATAAGYTEAAEMAA